MEQKSLRKGSISLARVLGSSARDFSEVDKAFRVVSKTGVLIIDLVRVTTPNLKYDL